jgi:N-acetylmuramidase-like protein/putative peptidoglycan binding protein
MDFTGPGAPMDQSGFDAARATADVPAAALWSVMTVETAGSGYLADRRPKILFERHIFHRLTGGKYDATHPEVSQKTAGGYGASGAHQYDRLAEALLLDETAALKSASWGLGQIMGENCAAAGYATVQEMVAAFVASENNQFSGMAAFLKSTGLAAKLGAQQWVAFARGYNGPGYAKNSYDKKLEANFTKYSTQAPPDLMVRAAQTHLAYGSYKVSIDGVMGSQTKAAVEAFQAKIGVAQTGVVDAALMQQLAQ